MLGEFKNTKKQGDAGLGYAIAYFCSQGIPVCIPLTDSQDYDLVIELDGCLKKVQVKTTKHRERNRYRVGLKIQGGNSKQNYIHKTGNEIVYDYLFVVTGDVQMYFIPKNEIKNHRSCLTLSEKWKHCIVT